MKRRCPCPGRSRPRGWSSLARAAALEGPRRGAPRGPTTRSRRLAPRPHPVKPPRARRRSAPGAVAGSSTATRRALRGLVAADRRADRVGCQRRREVVESAIGSPSSVAASSGGGVSSALSSWTRRSRARLRGRGFSGQARTAARRRPQLWGAPRLGPPRRAVGPATAASAPALRKAGVPASTMGAASSLGCRRAVGVALALGGLRPPSAAAAAARVRAAAAARRARRQRAPRRPVARPRRSGASPALGFPCRARRRVVIRVTFFFFGADPRPRGTGAGALATAAASAVGGSPLLRSRVLRSARCYVIKKSTAHFRASYRWRRRFTRFAARSKIGRPGSSTRRPTVGGVFPGSAAAAMTRARPK